MATYYVATTGNNSNPGTFGSPKLTIAAGQALLAAGDTLYIRAGTYDEQILEANFPASGTSWASPLTVAAYSGETVIVRPTSGTGNVVGFPAGTIAYVIFDRLIFDGEACGGDGGAAVGYLEAAVHHIRFTACHFRNGAGNGVLAVLGSTDLEFLDCHAYRNGLYSGYTISNGLYLECHNSLVRGGEFYNNEAFGIRCYASAGSTSGTRIERVRAYQNGYGRGLDGASVSAAGGGGIVIADVNQTVDNCLVYANYSGIWVYTDANGCAVRHCSVYGNDQEGIALQYYATTPTERNNIAYSNGTNRVDYTNTGNTAHSSNLIGTNPSWTNPGAGDFTLQSGSVARNAGTTLAEVTVDFVGTSRPQEGTSDQGAYEFVASGTTAIPGGTLTLTGPSVQLLVTPHGLDTAPLGLTGHATTRIVTRAGQVYRYARSAIARSGATRSGYYLPTVQILIGGVNRRSAVPLETLSIDEWMADQPNRCLFEVRGTAAEEPQAGQPVVIALGANQPELREFAGTILNVQQTMPRAAGAYSTWTVDAIDDQWLLDRRVVNASYASVSASDVARDLVARFTSGFSVQYIEDGLPSITVAFTNARPAAALSKVAAMVGATVFWDEGRAIYLYGTSTTVPQREPQALTNTQTQFWRPTRTTDLAQTRTRVIIEGQRTPALVSTPGGATGTVLASATVDYLVVAGGGVGGGSLGGGGGAGGVQLGSVVLAAGTYPVVVGAGGTGTSNGQDSSWHLFSARGGGRGGETSSDGGNGGSGGGGAFAHPRGVGTLNQGYNGGDGFSFGAGAGGGGGGAGSAGGAASANVQGTVGGRGGSGIPTAISGTLKYYAGGGGGNGSASSGTGGTGGGGNAGAGGNPGTPGTANTGGGGGGGGSYAGGSGVVIVRYLTGTLVATGGTITTAGGYTVHTFTASGTFVVTTVVMTAAPTTVLDLPVEDRSQLVATGGTVRIGPHILPYLSTFGPTVTSGQNAPGSFLTADAAPGATTLTLDNVDPITGTYGWVRVGDQVIRFNGKSGFQLTGIPSSGYGAITSDVRTDMAVTHLGAVRLSETGILLDPPVATGDLVIQRIQVDDPDAQALLAALEGGDGIHEHVIEAEQLDLQGSLDRAQAELDLFSRPVVSVTYETRDRYARAGRFVTVDQTGTLPITGRFVIQHVVVRFTDMASGAGRRSFPVRTVTAAPVRARSIIDALGTQEDALP